MTTMSIAAPTFSQVRGLVAALRQKYPDGRIIGIHTGGRWAGQDHYVDGDQAYFIEQCDSTLAVRMALRRPLDEASTLIIVTGLSDAQLDEDIRIRLTKHRLLQVDPWQTVRSLFQATEVDPRVARQAWMAEELLELVPSDGYAPAPGGFLDLERVWSVLLRARLDLGGPRPDLVTLLRWSNWGEARDRWHATSDSFRKEALAWLTQTAGPSAPFIMRIVSSHGPGEALAVGLMIDVIYRAGSVAGRRIERVKGRFEERYFGTERIETLARQAWKDAAIEVVRLHLNEHRRQRAVVVERAEQVLREMDASEVVRFSDVLDGGFEQRMAAFATALTDAMQRPTDASARDRVEEAWKQIRAHDVSHREKHATGRLERARMARRLLRWLATADGAQAGVAGPKWKSLGDSAQDHARIGSYLDWARLALMNGDPDAALSSAYSRLLDRVTTIRNRSSAAFARLLADWTAAGSPARGFVPIERVLAEVVAPIAATSPILLIVLDGMSFAVWRELQADLADASWQQILRHDQETPIIGLATVPSVTEASRTSLLCGALTAGDATTEGNGFGAHTALAATCRAANPPLLFHKAALANSGDDVVLAGEVRRAISNRQNQVVGVVLNAIDDQLFKGEQTHIYWNRESIRPLEALLHEARSAERLVVLISDHGHVLDHGSVARQTEGGGERWRLPGGALADDEVEVRGKRVLLAESGVLVGLATEEGRFGMKRKGYHGGLTPQEMLVPVVVLTAEASPPDGWREVAPETPAWWDLDGGQVVAAPAAPVYGEPAEPAPSEVADEGEGLLFPPPETRPKKPTKAAPAAAVGETGSAQAPPAWVEALLATSLFKSQHSMAGRTVPADDVFRQVLAALSERGGKMSTTAMAKVLSRPSHRVMGQLAVMQRVLNVEGFAVLTRDETTDTIELNIALAKEQFGLSE